MGCNSGERHGIPVLNRQCVKFVFCQGRMMKSWHVSTSIHADHNPLPYLARQRGNTGEKVLGTVKGCKDASKVSITVWETKRCLTYDVKRKIMCRKKKEEKENEAKVQPPFSSLSEHSTPGNDSCLGGVCSALPSVPWDLRKTSTLMHIIQPRGRGNLRHLTHSKGDSAKCKEFIPARVKTQQVYI